MDSQRVAWLGASSAVVALSLFLCATANANLIVNNSFESPSPLDACDPSLCTGSFRNFNAGDSFDGWSVVGAGQMTLASTDFSQFGFSFTAQDGQQWADLSGFGGNDPVGIQQSVATVVGDFYNLSFWLGNVVDTTVGLFGTTSTVEVLLNGTSLGLFTNSADGGAATAWQQFSLSFQASSISSTIAFFNRDAMTDNMNGLDNIVLTARPIEVPEPGTLGLFGLGLLGFGLLKRGHSRTSRPRSYCQ